MAGVQIGMGRSRCWGRGERGPWRCSFGSSGGLCWLPTVYVRRKKEREAREVGEEERQGGDKRWRRGRSAGEGGERDGRGGERGVKTL